MIILNIFMHIRLLIGVIILALCFNFHYYQENVQTHAQLLLNKVLINGHKEKWHSTHEH